MDIHWYNRAAPAFFNYLALFLDDLMEEVYASVEQSRLPNSVCTAHRISTSRIEAYPVPTAFISVSHPCDGYRLTNEYFKQYRPWQNVETFDFEAPYRSDGRGMKFYASEVRSLIDFLEKHTGNKLDMARLKTVVEETNKHYELLMECNDLCRSIPSPFPSLANLFVWHMIQNSPVGNGSPETTKFIEQWIKDGVNKLEGNKDDLQDEEKIRILWTDMVPFWGMELAVLLREEFGAKIVMDLGSFSDSTDIIDTSTEESMLGGIGHRNAHNGLMLNVVHGPIDDFLQRIVFIVKNYRIDCVIGLGHIGHKDCSATQGILKDTCKKVDVHLLDFSYDCFDSRVTTIDEMKIIFANFFDVMGLG
jgi:hypothetical protein